MKVCVQSYEQTRESCIEWAQEIEKSFVPDLIVFLAKSGFMYAEPIAEYFGCALADIKVSRSAVKKTALLDGFVKYVPRKIWLCMLSSPLMFMLNEREAKRYLEVTPRYISTTKGNYNRILVVDDSVDTGWSMRCILDRIAADFPGAEVKTAAYTVFQYSKNRVHVDYNVLCDQVIFNATSRRSEENAVFLSSYQKWCDEGCYTS